MLSGVVQGTVDETRVTADTIIGAVDELVALQNEESEVSMELSRLRRRLSDMAELRQSTAVYGDSLHLQMDRLRPAEWLSKLHDEEHVCPLCGNPAAASDESVEVLCSALRGIEDEAGHFGATAPAAFDREYERIQRDVGVHAEKLPWDWHSAAVA